MAVAEQFNGRSRDGAQYQRKYWITGTSDENVARAELLASSAAPLTLGGTFVRQDSECSVADAGENRFEGTCVWRTPEGGGQRPVNTFSVSFDISGQSQRITHARRHMIDYAPTGKTPKNYRGAINVTKDGVEGTDILVPTATFTVNYTFDNATITDAYFRLLGRMVGRMNDAAFLGHDVAELLLTRVSGQKQSGGGFDISFGFAISETEENLVIPGYSETGGSEGDILVALKYGWDYLWVSYQTKKVLLGDFQTTIQVAESAHIERVYKMGDMSLLGIGGGA